MKNKIYTSIDEITKDFIAQGWGNDLKFFKIRLIDSLIAPKNEELFMMSNGNLYNNKGKLICYNIQAIGQEGKLIPQLTSPYYLDDFVFLDC